MALGKRLIQTGGAAACLTETTDIFGDSSGKALYSMDFDASDTSGVYNGTPSNVDFGVSGKTLNGARFNGSSSKIDLPLILPANSTSSSSASCWFNTSYSGGNMGVILNAFTDDSNKPGWTLFTEANANFLRLLNYHIGGSVIATDGTTNVSDGNWHFVAVVFIYDGSSSSLKCYLDGNSTPEISITGFTPTRSDVFTERASIGYQNLVSGATRFFDGTIDQVRIFSKALLQSEMDTLWNSGNGETACVHTSTTDDIDYPVTNAAYYKLDNSAEDSKGTNDGTESNIEYRFGRYGQAAVFNGSSSKIEVSDPVIPVGATSISFWFNNDNTAGSLSGGETHYILGSGVSSLSKGLTAGFFQQKFFAVVNNGASSSSLTGTTLFSKTNWNHCAITWDGTTGSNKLKIYVNGNLEIEGASSIAASTIASYTNFAIGGTLSSGFIGGRVDQVRIFGSELSAANVLKLAEEKPETDTSNFKAVLYTGTNATQYISNVGMDLETSGGLVWVKNRTGTNSHALIDSVRGRAKYLYSDDTFLENSSGASNDLTSFEKNGFFVGSVSNAGSVNTSGGSIIGWVWKGGGTPVSNTNGANITSSVSANTAAGFSIVTYTGTGNGNVTSDTVGHGLSQTPDIVIVKSRTATDSWQVEANIGGTFKSGNLDGTGSFSVSSVADPTSTTFNPYYSNLAQNYVAYCFHSVSGYQKIGSYAGTGLAGNAQDVGFKPSFVIIKRTTATESWFIFDTRRPDKRLEADSSNSENTDVRFNLTSTGFDFDGNVFNESSNTYIYLAIK